jgi:hypothetical protein
MIQVKYRPAETSIPRNHGAAGLVVKNRSVVPAAVCNIAGGCLIVTAVLIRAVFNFFSAPPAGCRLVCSNEFNPASLDRTK